MIEVIEREGRKWLRVTDDVPPVGVPDGDAQLLPFTYRAAKLLRQSGIKGVPSFSATRYHWPGPFTPAHHQVETTEFMLYPRRLWCLNGMRTGKTASSIWAVDILMRAKEIQRVLVLCPLSIVYETWVQGFFQLTPDIDVAAAVGSTKNTSAVIHSKPQVIICNHDKIKYNYSDLTKYKPDLVIVDEASVFRSHTSERYKALKALVNNLKPRLWALTATPAGDKPTNVYAMAKLINPKVLPASFGAWQNKVCRRVTWTDGRGFEKQMFVPRAGWEDAVAAVLKPAIRYRTQDCIDMPPVVMVYRHAAMGKKQRDTWKLLKSKGVLLLDDKAMTAANAGVKVVKLLQVSSGLVYDKKGQSVEVDASNKMHELEAVLDEAEGKVIVFTPFRHVMEWVVKQLKKRGHAAEHLSRDHSLNHRTDVFARFQRGSEEELKVLVMHPAIAKYGLTLTAANTTVWWGPIFSSETFEQANMRMQGPGDHANGIVMLYSTEAEKTLYEKLQDGSDVQSAIVDVYKREVAT